MNITSIHKPIAVPQKDEVSPDSQLLLNQIQRRMGKVPNLYATIGYSANALKGILGLEESLNKGVFSPKVREAIYLVVSEVNNCNYCLAAHTMLAIDKGFSEEETLAIRKGQAEDAKLEAVIQLAKSIAEKKGNADKILVANFFEAGYNETALIELVGLVSLRSFTNYVYSLTNIPIDFPEAKPLASSEPIVYPTHIRQ
jgi:AhpD family alkylhydroperoxidase